MIDISFLISKSMENQRDADKELINFATGQKVKFSYYTGDKSLYSCIWNKFTFEEKFAFYLLCVEKDKKGQWNFDKFEYYKTLSSDYLNNDKFMNSFKNISQAKMVSMDSLKKRMLSMVILLVAIQIATR